MTDPGWDEAGRVQRFFDITVDHNKCPEITEAEAKLFLNGAVEKDAKEIGASVTRRAFDSETYFSKSRIKLTTYTMVYWGNRIRRSGGGENDKP